MHSGRALLCAIGIAALAARADQVRATEPKPAAELPGVAVFSRHSQFIDAKISPKGTYLAAISTEGGKRTLAFFDLKTRKGVSVLKPDFEAMVWTYHWVNDERVVAEVVGGEGHLAGPVRRGELYAVDANGNNGRMVFGYRATAEMQTGSHIKKAQQDWASGFFVDRLRGDDRNVLIEVQNWDRAADNTVHLYKLDTYTGLKSPVSVSPLTDSNFITDENGEARIVYGRDLKYVTQFYLRNPGGTWAKLEGIKNLGHGVEPVGYVERDHALIVEEEGPEGFGLYSVGLDGGARKLLAKNELAPANRISWDPVTGRSLAVEYQPDLPTVEFVDPNHPVNKAIDGLLAAYPGEHVRLMNTTDDGKKAVVQVYSDRNPGHFVVLDVAAMTADPIVQTRPWINPEAMAETNAFHMAASDGFRIHGYVTAPRGYTPGSGAPPPLVVLPHGGPHGVRDAWGFDPEVQLLASRGFAVLQVNYRGSGGYGLRFEEAGHRQWGGKMVQDVVDATRWAIKKGYGDAKRICIYGASYGAYAALQSSIVAPDLFRCAVGYAGIYDLGLMWGEGDIRLSRVNRGYLKMVLGEDEKALKAASPVYNADKIQARVMLIHGGEDKRAPIEHAERIKKALTERGKRPEWLVESKEGHGFYDEKARERMYTRLVSFLEENTKVEAASPAGAKVEAPAGAKEAPAAVGGAK